MDSAICTTAIDSITYVYDNVGSLIGKEVIHKQRPPHGGDHVIIIDSIIYIYDRFDTLKLIAIDSNVYEFRKSGSFRSISANFYKYYVKEYIDLSKSKKLVDSIFQSSNECANIYDNEGRLISSECYYNDSHFNSDGLHYISKEKAQANRPYTGEYHFYSYY